MDYVTVLRGLGCDENKIKEWENILNSIEKSFIGLMTAGLIFIPIVFAYFLIKSESNENVFMILYLMAGAIAISAATYFTIKINTNFKKFTDMTIRIWLPHPIQYILRSTPVFIIYSLMSVEAFIIFLFVWIMFGEILFLIGGTLILIAIPILLISMKKSKYGLSISRVVKEDTDIIADKISMVLNAEKKLIFKSQTNRCYSIDLPQYSINIWVSRDTNNKEYTHISVRGVKEENLNLVRHIIKKIDDAIYGKSPENY